MASSEDSVARVVNPTVDGCWNSHLNSHPQATVFHTSAWAELLQHTYGFNPQYVVCERQGEWLGLLPLMETRSWFGQRRGVSLPFTDQCPLLMPSEEPEARLSDICIGEPPNPPRVGDLLLGQARRIAIARGWRRIEFRPAPALLRQESASVAFLSHELALTPSDEDQRSLCAPATRRTLRQALASPLAVTVGSSITMVRKYYELHCLTRRRQGGIPQPYEFFSGLQRIVLDRGLGFVVIAREFETPVAGAVFLRFGRKAVYKYGASDQTRQKHRPNQLVMWTGLRHAAGLGCHTLDMGRTSVGNEGLSRFKSSWGALERHLGYYCFDLQTGRKVRLRDLASGWQSRWLKRLPTRLGRLLGTFAYRFAA